MKNLFIITLLTIYGLSAWGQSNNIKLRIYNPAVAELCYERAIQQNKSILFNVKAGLYDFTGEWGLPTGGIVSANIGYRNYFANTRAMDGLYLEGELGIGQASASGSRYIGSQKISAFHSTTVKKYARGIAEVTIGRLGLNMGYQKRWNTFSIDFGVGIIYSTPISGDRSISLSDGSSLKLPNYINGFRPNGYLGLGIAF